MSEELKPCPFCGQRPHVDAIGSKETPIRYCSCVNVDCDVDCNGLAGDWNTRPIEDALRERAEKAEGEVVEQAEQIVKLCNDLTYLGGMLPRAGVELDQDAPLVAQIVAYVGGLEREAEFSDEKLRTSLDGLRILAGNLQRELAEARWAIRVAIDRADESLLYAAVLVDGKRFLEWRDLPAVRAALEGK